MGFEPTVGFRTADLQSAPLDHSGTRPNSAISGRGDPTTDPIKDQHTRLKNPSYRVKNHDLHGMDRTLPIPLSMHRAHLHLSPIVLSVLAGIAPVCSAQDFPGSAEQVEQARSILPRVETNQTAIMPTQASVSVAVQPGLGEGPDWLDVLNDTLETKLAPSTLAEGSFIQGRVGDLVLAPSGQVIFVPDRAEREPGEGAVILLPCRALERLQEEWSNQRVVVSGEVLTYHQRNMLLLSDYRLVREQPNEIPQQPATEPGTEIDEPEGLEADPEVRDLLRELDRPDPNDPREGADLLRNRLEALPRTPQRDTSAQTTGPEEGTLLLRRPARLVRNADGAWALAFDNDDPTDMKENASIIVLPSRALMRMEQWAMDQGDAARFLVSGRVYAYRGQSYLHPTIAQRLGASDINSIQ